MQGGEIKHFGTRPLRETPRQSKKRFIWIFVALIFIVCAGYWLSTIKPIYIPEEEPLQKNEEALIYFTETIQNKVIMLGGHTIEGFEPSMFMQTYPGFINEDFNGVEARQGVYRVSNGEIIFEEFVTELLPHSEGHSIPEIGMAHLFNNVMSRMGINSPTKDSVIQTLLFLEEQPLPLEDQNLEEYNLQEELL